MNETPPDRLSTDTNSPFYNAEMLERGVGIRFKGVEKNNVEQYCRQRGVGFASPQERQRTAAATP